MPLYNAALMIGVFVSILSFVAIHYYYLGNSSHGLLSTPVYDERIQRLVREYLNTQIDTDHDKELSIFELRMMIDQSYEILSKSQIKLHFKSLLNEENGNHVDVAVLKVAEEGIANNSIDLRLKEADVDSNGKLDVEEFAHFWYPRDEILAQEVLDSLSVEKGIPLKWILSNATKYDVDGDNLLNLDEVVEWLIPPPGNSIEEASDFRSLNDGNGLPISFVLSKLEKFIHLIPQEVLLKKDQPVSVKDLPSFKSLENAPKPNFNHDIPMTNESGKVCAKNNFHDYIVSIENLLICNKQA